MTVLKGEDDAALNSDFCRTLVDWPSRATSRDPVSTPAASAPPPGAAALTTVRSNTFSTVIPSFWDEIVTEYSSLLRCFARQGRGTRCSWCLRSDQNATALHHTGAWGSGGINNPPKTRTAFARMLSVQRYK